MAARKNRIQWKKTGGNIRPVYRGWVQLGPSGGSGLKFTMSLTAHKPPKRDDPRRRDKMYYVRAQFNAHFGDAPAYTVNYAFRAKTLANVKKKSELLLSGAMGADHALDFALDHEIYPSGEFKTNPP